MVASYDTEVPCFFERCRVRSGLCALARGRVLQADAAKKLSEEGDPDGDREEGVER
jgi:hypothetical protein